MRQIQTQLDISEVVAAWQNTHEFTVRHWWIKVTKRYFEAIEPLHQQWVGSIVGFCFYLPAVFSKPHPDLMIKFLHFEQIFNLLNH